MSAVLAMAGAAEPEGEPSRDAKSWTTVGWAAFPLEKFQRCKEAVLQGADRPGLQEFASSPMGAVWEVRKTSVRSLGGTLSSSTAPRRKSLRASRTAAEMDRALKDPNFVIFELVTKENVPELLSKKILQLSDDQIYYLAVQQCPFLPDSTFTANFKLRARHCTIQPRVIGPWVCTTTSTSPAHALFKYYIAIDDLSNENSLEEACVGPLLRLLGNNAASSEHPFQVGGEISYPVCSSEVQAMTLGFFAFKRMDLKLVRIEYPGLITTEPAISHPMGAFWMLPLKTLSKYRDWKTVQLNYAPFQMCMTWLTEDCYSSEDLYKDAMTTNLKKRKSALIAEVAELKDALNMKQAELASIENSLSSDR